METLHPWQARRDSHYNHGFRGINVGMWESWFDPIVK